MYIFYYSLGGNDFGKGNFIVSEVSCKTYQPDNTTLPPSRGFSLRKVVESLVWPVTFGTMWQER